MIRYLYCPVFQKIKGLGQDCVKAALGKNKVNVIFEEDRRHTFNMKKIIALSTLLALSALGMACGPEANTNTAANKAVANAMNAANAAVANAVNAVNAAVANATNKMAENKPATNAPATNTTNTTKPVNK